MTLTGRRVVLGVSGGIACYKSCTIARRLTELGAAVDVVLTAGATEFVRPLTFEALTRRPVLTSLWDRDRALSHIDLARGAEVIVIAPATAHVLGRAAQGLADDLLTTMLLAADVPVLAAPGMNDHMWAHPATQANVATLVSRGWTFIGPVPGPLAEGPSDRPGRMAEPDTIVAHVERALLGRTGGLRGRRIVVTAGPTREPLDPVRVLTNPSSGRMGYAIAARAFARGAEVVLVSGPTALPAPPGIEPLRVTTTDDLLRAVEREIAGADVLIMAAAPADFRPTDVGAAKVPRAAGPIDVRLEPTPDILERTAARRGSHTLVVGFALEAGSGAEERAKRKLESKRLDLIVLNRADEPESGFEADTNRVTLIDASGATPLDRQAKSDVADRILDRVEHLL